jgi:hypothetical protein
MTSLPKFSIATTIAAVAIGTAALGFAAPVLAAPAGPTVDKTVSTLKAAGYDVILNRIGAAPLSQCTVSAVRPGQEVTRTDSGNPGDVLATTVIAKTVYVDVAC